jgi:hypothetical protein
MNTIPAHFRPLDHLDDARRTLCPGTRLDDLRRAAPRLREAILASGKPNGVRTYDLITFPYPTKFGLQGAALIPLPFVMMRNRVQIVQWISDGARRTLLVNPSDYERSVAAPFFAKQIEIYGQFVARSVMSQRHGTVESALSAAGVRPSEVDYVTFDHLHVQDVRGLLGTGDTPGLLPNARLIAQRDELRILEKLHPLQRPWYVEGALDGVDPKRIIAIDQEWGDVLLGPGVALVRTPGHTAGNHTICLNTDDGLWTISENGIAVDAYAPYASQIPGVRRYAQHQEVEVILNANTREHSLDQYTSMVLEKHLADPCRRRPEFPCHFPSSELTAHPFAPGLGPTYSHGAITHGQLGAGPTAAATVAA